MLHNVLVPQMGESVLEGSILEWKVALGDKVEINQPLVELMTDKVNVEIPAENAGVIKELLVEVGETVAVGAVIAKIEGAGEATQSAKSEPAPASPPKSAAKAAPAQVAPVRKASGKAGSGKMSPKVRMMVREFGLDLSVITPTGKNGLVTVDDVQRAVDQRSASAGFNAGPIPAPPRPMAAGGAKIASGPKAAPLVEVTIPKFPPLPKAQAETRMPLTGVRKMISDHMVRSEATAVHVTTFEDIDLTALVNVRKEIKEDFIRTYGANITFLPFIIQAACQAMLEYPAINASITDDEIIIKHTRNFGIAVAREDGLIVPVIKNADRKSIVELAVEITQLGQKAHAGQLAPDDVTGGTFTLTNAGMFGATASTPIISQPQVAILGIHAITKRPWVVNDEIVIRHISSFGLSFDHRLIDGHIAVQFLHRIHEILASPAKMLLGLR